MTGAKALLPDSGANALEARVDLHDPAVLLSLFVPTLIGFYLFAPFMNAVVAVLYSIFQCHKSMPIKPV